MNEDEKNARLGNASHYPAAWRILEASIPVDERRSWDQQCEIFQDPRYNFYPYLDGTDQVYAVIGFWAFKKFIFIEHFAVSSECRNNGVGTRILSDFCSNCVLPVIVESEPPEIHQIAKRRLEWYGRLNFKLNTLEYMQPPYSSEKKAVGMKLLSFPKALDNAEIREVVNTLYSEVYRVGVSP